MSFPFNIRVYGALIMEGEVLLSHERIFGKPITKLPGGGLEFGEGLRDCLKREFKEETGLDVRVADHIYTTDFFQLSAFNTNHQVISVYYLVLADELTALERRIKALENDHFFTWKAISSLQESDFTLPIDKEVCRLLKALRP